MIRLIGAIGLDRSIGVYETKKGRLPWPHELAEGDLQHFSNITEGSTVVMGRKTFESLGQNPLPDRNNVVISSKRPRAKGVSHFTSLREFLNSPTNKSADISVIGGAGIFKEALKYADEVILTVVPFKSYEHYELSRLVYFPEIPKTFTRNKTVKHPLNPNLLMLSYNRAK